MIHFGFFAFRLAWSVSEKKLLLLLLLLKQCKSFPYSFDCLENEMWSVGGILVPLFGFRGEMIQMHHGDGVQYELELKSSSNEKLPQSVECKFNIY